MKHYSKLSITEILTNYELPKRLVVYFFSQVAKDLLKTEKAKQDPRTLKAIDIAERYGNGEDFTSEELKKVADDAYTAYTYAYTAAAADATYASYAASYATYTASYTASAASTAFAASTAYTTSYATHDKYKDLLVSIIEERLTELDRILMGLPEK
jgi:hypothetical protein